MTAEKEKRMPRKPVKFAVALLVLITLTIVSCASAYWLIKDEQQRFCQDKGKPEYCYAPLNSVPRVIVYETKNQRDVVVVQFGASGLILSTTDNFDDGNTTLDGRVYTSYELNGLNHIDPTILSLDLQYSYRDKMWYVGYPNKNGWRIIG